MMNLPFGVILMALCLVSLLWGIVCIVVGGMVRFNIEQYINDYISDLDEHFYQEKAPGLISMKDSYEGVDLGSAPKTIGIMAIIVGVLVVVYSLVGLVAGLLKNMSLLFVLIGCILVSTMLQFVTIWMIIDVNSSFHDSAKDNLVERVKSEYTLDSSATEWSMMLNSIMLAGQCCGIKGPGDFHNMTLQYTTGEDQSILVSPACCKGDIWIRGRDALVDCGVNLNSDHNEEGCYNTLFDDAYEGDLFTYMVLLFLITGWQCLAMAIGVLMLFNPPEDDFGKSAGGRAGGPGGGPDHRQEIGSVPESEMKMFTPFSKISSYQDADINRIKSTEIW